MKRMGLMVITFFITIFLFFMFIKLIPDNHIPAPLSGDDWYEIYKEREGWDKPIPVQFALWIRNILDDGSFGFSVLYKQPKYPHIRIEQHLPYNYTRTA